jgi:hypothetical protein
MNSSRGSTAKVAISSICSRRGKKMKLACIVLGAILVMAAAPPPAGWETVRNDIDIYPNFKTKSVTVRGTIVVRRTGAPSDDLTLHLGHDLTPYFKAPAGFAHFERVSSAGGETKLNQPGDKPGIMLATIHFRIAPPLGQKLTIPYKVEIDHNSFTFVITDRLAMGAGGTGWYPRVLNTGSDLDSGIDPTPGLIRIHLPSVLRSLASGTYIGRTRDKRESVDTWRHDVPLARSFVLGPYHDVERTVGGVRARILSLTPAMNADELAAEVAKIIAVLSARYGKYPYSKYGAAEFPDDAVKWWGIALGDFQILRTSLVKAADGGFVPLAHEIGHAWWGNLVSPASPGAYMLSEALAGYSSLVALESVFGPDRFRHALLLQEPGMPPDYTLENHFKFVAEGKDVALSQQQEGGKEYQLASVKGVIFYHMLRRRVGDDIFFKTLQNLVSTHRNRKLSLDDLRTAFMTSAPAADLTTFFEQWLDRTGAPNLKGTVTCDGSHEPVDHLHIDQLQPGPAYDLDVPITLVSATGTSDYVVRMRDKSLSVDLPAQQCATVVKIDPGHDLFLWPQSRTQ